MSTFADYTFYTEHGGKLSEADYNASVDDAYAEILSQTNGAALAAPDGMKEAVQLCECALVDVLASYREGAALLPKGIGSVSNDSYSVSTGNGELTTVQTQSVEVASICARFLQWPVNLMCRWL